MDPAELLGTAKARAHSGKLMLYARRAVEGMAGGIHSSPQKGSSLEFKQHRPYVPGDEIRRIDWRAFGRSDKYFIREYEEETNLQATLVVDASGSMAYGDGDTEKFHFAARFAMVFSHLLLAQADSVGLVMAAGEGSSDLPCKASTGHLRRIADALSGATPSGQADYVRLMATLQRRVRRRGLVVFLTDALFPPAAFVKAVGQLAHRGSEVVVFQVLHPDELTFPFDDLSRFIDLEGQADIDSLDPRSIRKSYLERLEALTLALGGGLEKHRVDLVQISSDMDPGKVVSKYLVGRMSGRKGTWRMGGETT